MGKISCSHPIHGNSEECSRKSSTVRNISSEFLPLGDCTATSVVCRQVQSLALASVDWEPPGLADIDSPVLCIVDNPNGTSKVSYLWTEKKV